MHPPSKLRTHGGSRRNRVTGAALAVTAFAACFFGAGTPSASAATAASPDDSMPELVVTGERAGPGLWHVQRGSAQLWILGTVAPLPKDMTWRSRQVERILGDSTAVLVAKPFQVGIVRLLWLMVTKRDLLMLPGGRKLKDVLPPERYARFAAQRARFTSSADKWERFRPIVAMALLEEAALRRVGLSTRLDVAAEVRKLARKHDVPVEEVKLAGLGDALDILKTLPPDTEGKCAAAALATVETGLPRLVARAQAWATGDVARIRGLPEGPEVGACRAAVGGGGGATELLGQIRRAWLAAMEERLRRGGSTLAVVGMDLLIEPGGLLDELRARGYRVDGP